jgi:hypothetical protein
VSADDPYRECRELHWRWAAERRKDDLVAMAGFLGIGIEAARARERARERSHPDYVLATAMRRVLASANPRATLERNPKAVAALEADQPLQAYINTLIEAGPDAVKEAGNQLRDLQFLSFGERSRDIAINIVRAALARWRAWGQMIVDADESAI